MANNLTGLVCIENSMTNATCNGSIEDVNVSIGKSYQIDTSDILSKEMADHMVFALECVVFPIVTVFGVTGNILSIIVLFQRKIFGASSTVVLLLGLTVADVLFLVSSYFRKVTCIISHFDQEIANWYNMSTFQTLYYLRIATSRVSTYLVVAISIERYLAVVFPLKIKELTSKGKMSFIVFAIYIFTFAALSLIPLQYAPRKLGGKYFIVPTKFYLENKSILTSYNHIILPIAFRWVPKVLVITFNSLICYCLLRRMKLPLSNKHHRMSVRKTEEQNRVTKMLLVVAVTFVVCLIPGDIHVVVAETLKEFAINGKYRNSFLAFSDVSLLFEMINSSVNFVIYMALNKTFSSVYRLLFCSSCQKSQSGMRNSRIYASSYGKNDTVSISVTDLDVNGK